MKNLSKLMEERGLEPRDFYIPLRMNASTFYRKRKGEQEFTHSQIVKILEIFNSQAGDPEVKFEDL